MNHDPLCGWSSGNDCKGDQPHKEFPKNTNGYNDGICHWCGYECGCDLIAKVRQDERTRHDGQSVMLARDAEAAITAAFEDGLHNRDMEWQTRQLAIEEANLNRHYAQGKAEAIAGAAKRLEEYLQHGVADGWMTRGKVDGILDIVRNVSQ